MSLLSALLGPSRKQPVQRVWSADREERHARRYAVSVPVCIGPLDDMAVAGTMLNVSLTGAAIRIEGSARWLSRLDHGDEMSLAGLLDRGLLCWVVTLDEDVLRVHFHQGRETADQLREAMQRLTAST